MTYHGRMHAQYHSPEHDPTPEEAAEQVQPIDLSRIPTRGLVSKACVRLLLRANKIGWEAAIEREVDNPALPEDPWYCGLVCALAAGKPAPPAPADPDPIALYMCETCSDHGWVSATASSVRPCSACYLGKAISTRWRDDGHGYGGGARASRDIPDWRQAAGGE